MKNEKQYDRYVRKIDDAEVKQWKPAAKSITTELFEAFLLSRDTMVEVMVNELPLKRDKEDSGLKSTRQDRFASAFYAWKKSRKKYIESLGFKDILLIRRDERVALKKTGRV